MTFTSLKFYFFLPVVYLIFYFTVDRWRWLVLLVASYSFYASFKAPYLIVVLSMVTCISYACGLRIGSQQDEARRKHWLWVGIISCVVILALLKYLPFLEARTDNIFGLSSTLSKSIISIGVSYFTFQAISYLADIYLELEEPEIHFGRYALYLAFFPKLLQGPIERAGDLIPQLKQPYLFDYDAMRSGILLFIWGLFKKVVIADRFALFADQVYNNVHNYTGLPLIIGTYAFAFQIFFDFSAYTDMARGVARMFGINLTENFNSPYLATSIADFWRRWHISFSRWILDYIFKPLQMGWRNSGRAGTASALLITFLVSGIWHGATWGFVIWGVLHGIYLAASTYYKPYQKRFYKSLEIEKSKLIKWWQVIVTFNLVSFAWVFFRANDVRQAVYIISNTFNGTKGVYSDFYLSQGSENIIILSFSIIIVLFYNLVRSNIIIMSIWNKYCGIRWFFYYSILFIIFYFGSYNSDFIYFQF